MKILRSNLTFEPVSRKELGIEEARKRLSRLVIEAQQGADIVITYRGRPAARIVAYHQEETAVDTVKLTPAQRAFLEAVKAGTAIQLRRDNPYKTYAGDSRRAVARPVLDAVKGLVELDFDNGDTWEVPYRLTDAGEAALNA